MAAWQRERAANTISDVVTSNEEREYLRRLGSTIAQLRAIRGVSQAAVAEALNRSEAALSRWENGKAAPKAYDLVRIARVLRAPARLLLDPPSVPLSPVALLLEEEGSVAMQDGLRLLPRAAEET